MYQKYIKTSAIVGYASTVWKWAWVQVLKESRLTIRGNENQGLNEKLFYETTEWCTASYIILLL